MVERIQDEHCFILHTRAFRSHSLLVDVITVHYGKLRMVAKAAKSRRYMANFSPFCELLCAFSHRGELATLHKAETASVKYFLPPHRQLYGLYINELLYRLLPFSDQDTAIYDLYRETLLLLVTAKEDALVHWSLRLFEKRLLDALGYALAFDTASGDRVRVRTACGGLMEVHAAAWQALFSEEPTDCPRMLLQVKKLLRYQIKWLLGGKLIHSGDLVYAAQSY